MKRFLLFSVAGMLAASTLQGCKKSGSDPDPVPVAKKISVKRISLDAVDLNSLVYDAGTKPVIRVVFDQPAMPATVSSAVQLLNAAGAATSVTTTLQNNDSVLLVQPTTDLDYLSKFKFTINANLKSASGGALISAVNQSFVTKIDSAAKFPLITDDALLTLVQEKTFSYFWDFAHPVSGLARERNTSGDIVTSGGSGFGIMAIVTGIHRNFVSRADGLARMKTIVAFLKNNASKFHGAFPHWLNGSTGATVAFSTKDDGADLVETSYLVMGLLTARQFFNGTNTEETTLRADINAICNGVEWGWFRKGNEEQLYWHWSETYNWDMNLPVRGWNECLVTYILAASSPTHGIPVSVYTNGWTANGSNGFINGKQYQGITLPLGPAYGGPLFFSHYSFLGIDPNGLKDAYADYSTQTTNHTLINYAYCKANPNKYFGYSDAVWGLTASDIPNGYSASSPTNDLGVIAPTAAISSMPYAPEPALKALKFFYYTLGDKLWKEYGFVDAFSLKELWFADSFLAIDQGPMIIMIENYRSGLLWDLFTSCPEVKSGMKTLGFSAPYLP